MKSARGPRLAGLAALAVGMSTLLTPARAQEAVVELDASCLCIAGNNPKRYFGRIAITKENRDRMKELIEKNTFGLEKRMTLRGIGCGKDSRLSGMDARCGDTSTPGPRVGGKATFVSVPNVEFSGEVTIQITDNSGIPLLAGTPQGQPVIDIKRWPQATVVGVGGKALKVAPK